MSEENAEGETVIDLTNAPIGLNTDVSISCAETMTSAITGSSAGLWNHYLTTQDPRYVINNDGKLCGAVDKEPIPQDEPVFILRANDPCAIYALAAYADNYMSRGGDLNYAKQLADSIAKFQEFAYYAGFRMKMPK